MKTECAIAAGALLLTLAGCTNYVLLSESRAWPKDPSFRTPIPSADDNKYVGAGLDFDAVYCLPPESNTSHRVVNFYRFWPNGRVMIRGSIGFPALHDAESFESAYIGYYRIDGQHLDIELFVPLHPPWTRDYEIEAATVEKDRIVGLQAKIRRDVRKYELVYIKRPMPGMKRQPDW